jgi:hypothetical protein
VNHEQQAEVDRLRLLPLQRFSGKRLANLNSGNDPAIVTAAIVTAASVRDFIVGEIINESVVVERDANDPRRINCYMPIEVMTFSMDIGDPPKTFPPGRITFAGGAAEVPECKALADAAWAALAVIDRDAEPRTWQRLRDALHAVAPPPTCL